MKKLYFICTLLLAIAVACHREHREKTIKDLDENMMDLRVYQENLGDMLKQNRLPDAVWLLEGADSLLQVMANTFPAHRKLTRPFGYFYEEKLQPPLQQIENAIEENSQERAVEAYRTLVKKCNRCHVDHEIDKEVKF